MAYSLCIGAGIAATNTYLPLYSYEQFRLSEESAGMVLAVLGVSGIIARIVWSQLSDRMSDASTTLVVLAVAAVGFAVLLWQAARVGTALLWIGALGTGASAVAANAVSMLVVVKGSGFRETGHASALVSLGFFAGFVFSPPAFGALTDATGSYAAGWLLVTFLFALAAALGSGCRRAGRAQAP
jgi:nitrate/nitrite transporter NarK